MRQAVILLLMFCLVCPAWGQEELRTSGNVNYPPSSWAHKGEMLGVGAEIVRAIFADRSVSVVSRDVGPWARVQYLAQVGKLDIVTTIYRTPERESYLLYTSMPYMSDENVVFVRKGHEFSFSSWEDLVGRVGGVVVGDSYGKELDEIIKVNLSVERTSNLRGNLEKLAAGRVDYVPYGRYSGLFEIERLGLGGRISMLPVPLSSEGLYLAVSRDSRYAGEMEFIQQRLMQLLQNGTVEQLIDKAVQDYRSNMQQ